jgi:D-3-phosphoglycerate dehydrogenase
MTKTKPRVVYTDPRWAVTADGKVDLALGDIEREVYGEAVDLEFGIYENGRFVTEGPRLVERLRGASAVLVLRTQIDAPVIDVLAPTCRVVGRQGVGYDNLDLLELERRGILAFNVPDYCTSEVSDHALALILALERRIVLQNAQIKSGRWKTEDAPIHRRLGNLTFGIVGLGRIGRAVARKAAAFYGTLQAYDPYVSVDGMAGLGVRKCANLTELLATSDVVTVHAPLSPQTHFLIGRADLPAIKPGALLINTARGNLVEPEAVLEALESGRLGGYGSDVFTPEDPNEHPVNRRIIAFDNVVVTPHSAFRSADAIRSVRRRVSEEIRRVLVDGEPPRFGRLV